MYRTQFIYRQETITVLSWKYVYSLQFLEYGKDDKDILSGLLKKQMIRTIIQRQSMLPLQLLTIYKFLLT